MERRKKEATPGTTPEMVIEKYLELQAKIKSLTTDFDAAKKEITTFFDKLPSRLEGNHKYLNFGNYEVKLEGRETVKMVDDAVVKVENLLGKDADKYLVTTKTLPDDALGLMVKDGLITDVNEFLTSKMSYALKVKANDKKN